MARKLCGVNMDDEEMWTPLTELAKVRGSSASQIIRDLVRAELIKARKAGEIPTPPRKRHR